MSAPKPPPLSDRITCRYEGGPLDGRTAHHIARPKALAPPILHRHTTCLKGEDIDRTAAGLYQIEERELLQPDLPQLPLDAEAEEAIGIESLHEAKSKPRPKQFEFVAVHHPSKADEDWHEVEKPKPEAVKPPDKNLKKPVQLPDNHPLAKKLARLAAARKAMPPAEVKAEVKAEEKKEKQK